MAIYAKSAIGVSFPTTTTSEEFVAWVKKNLVKAGFQEDLISVVSYKYSTTYYCQILYNGIAIGCLDTSASDKKAWVEMAAGKGVGDIVFLLIRRGEGTTDANWEEQDILCTSFYISNSNSIIYYRDTIFAKSNPSKYEKAKQAISFDYFSPIADSLPLSTGYAKYASKLFDTYGIWDEVIRTNVQGSLLKKYTIDNEEYVCISSSPNAEGAIFAKLTTE